MASSDRLGLCALLGEGSRPVHSNELDIDDALVRRLVDDQFPDLRGRRLQRFRSPGTVNVVYRLGDDLAVRLPRMARWVESLERELRWLPLLALRLPLTIPQPVEAGRPTEDYPVPWAIFRWIEGHPWKLEDVARAEGAVDVLAEFVLALRRVDTTGAPPPGEHGRPLRERDAAVRWALGAGAGLFDVDAATRAWERALHAPPWSGVPAWVHGDLLPGNVLVRDGKVHAVIDFGTAHAGDPAMDVQPAWSLFDRAGRDRYRRLLDVDDATWERARGDAIANVVGVVYYRTSNPSFASECRARVEAACDD